jgi:hypothetical protein
MPTSCSQVALLVRRRQLVFLPRKVDITRNANDKPTTAETVTKQYTRTFLYVKVSTRQTKVLIHIERFSILTLQLLTDR